MFEVEGVTGNYSSFSNNFWTPVSLNEGNDGENEFAMRMFGDPKWAMSDGTRYIDDRTNTSMWNFDQSKITAGLQDLLNSASQAALQFGTQQAGDLINREANSNKQWSGLFRSFQSTATGAQLNAGSYAFKVKEFFANPIVWLGAFAVVALVLIRR